MRGLASLALLKASAALKTASSCSFSKMNHNTKHELKEKTMKNLKRLSAAVVLTYVLSLSAFAGELSTGPCAPPEPGQTSTPPCSGGQIAPDPTPGQLETPPASAAADATALAISLFESLLPIF
jgi:hypothetical protein